jgi:16S rRNA A1518/A1519 N6-dimethyltransferase RsmA/KsgA/DIM1 with predicted DNA glycosylase/AP lyase activity
VNSGINRVIAVENEKKLILDLKSLEAESENKVTLCEKNPFLWDTYETLKAPEYLGPNISKNWEHLHSKLIYTGTIPKSRQGELFIGQLYDCILQRMSMYQFGRVRMLLWVPKPFTGKIVAPLGSKERCKLSFVADACANTRVVESTADGDMFPSYEYDLIDIHPFEISKMTAPSDAFYYVVRHLMVTRRHKLTNAIGMLGPGADIILSRLKFDHNVEIRDMTVDQVNEVALRFDEWPLRPRVLHEDTDIMDASRRRGMSAT